MESAGICRIQDAVPITAPTDCENPQKMLKIDLEIKFRYQTDDLIQIVRRALF